MSWNPFSVLRRWAAQEIVKGVADGLQAVAPDGEEAPANLGELRAMLAAPQPKALPAAEEEPAKKGRK